MAIDLEKITHDKWENVIIAFSQVFIYMSWWENRIDGGWLGYNV